MNEKKLSLRELKKVVPVSEAFQEHKALPSSPVWNWRKVVLRRMKLSAAKDFAVRLIKLQPAVGSLPVPFVTQAQSRTREPMA